MLSCVIVDSGAIKFRGQFMLGDLVWVRVQNRSWWPAQVVDEKSVSESCKPKKKSEGEVLVRVYGSYKYLYVNHPVRYRSEFEKILKQNNGSYREVFEKALEQNLSHLRSSSLKRSVSKSEDGSTLEAAENATNLKDEARKKHKSNSSAPVGHS